MEVKDQESGSGEMEYEGEHRWTARGRTVIARMEQYLNENDNMKVEIEEFGVSAASRRLGSGFECGGRRVAGSFKFSA